MSSLNAPLPYIIADIPPLALPMLRGDQRPKAGSLGVEEAEEAEGYRALPLPMEPLLTLVLEKDKRKLAGDLR